MTAQPWMKFYPSDWRADPALRMCSLAARGLWMEMLCLMHDAEPYGSLLINEKEVTEKQLAALCGVPTREVQSRLAELEGAGVFSRDAEQGTIYSRRMRRDREKLERDKANGKGGGNPRLKGGVNPQDKAQIPDARYQKEKDAAPAALPGFEEAPTPPPPADTLERQLFDRGKQVLGKDAGGLIAKLLKAKKGDVALARAAIEQASTKQDAREYIGAVMAGGHASADGRRLTNDEQYWGVGRIPGVV